ncbi:homogentisate 1,2-dioxygenase [Thauera sp. Sel9]|uniref:homogentisate 1,2-dioxygenase n=1 Tax=Thauera sp. Sel9 TaxID=2974299 RepID=UPI0021E160D6|nr:homogentisate 1,2-dioxygenase [Thauera sp. Sel9]MCV2217083.1 homogentisate 1,2-dioxygenase [Thauera sp. Sel9]
MTVTTEVEFGKLSYLSGWGNECSSEALPDALPTEQNSPQQCPYGLYAEQFSGTAFTAPRHANRRSWLYRIRPTSLHQPFERIDNGRLVSDFSGVEPSPNQFRWNPMPIPAESTDFLQGLVTMAGNADVAIHLYAASRSMGRRVFYNADAEMLIVPQQGRLRFTTEFGLIDAEPQEIVIIPRGIRFRVDLPDGSARGYVCENFGAGLRLPDMGVIGSNGLANARHFEIPVAWYEDVDGDHELVAKFGGNLWRAKMGHSPFDVVAWYGNHLPCKYDLRRYNTIGSISYDHPDPCIFLVLQSPSAVPGVDSLDFVIFPPRILAMEHTFRPPWFHRNIAAEFMGLIHGIYDAKAEGFAPGGCSLHNSFTGHGPDGDTFDKASTADTSKPDYIRDTMAFMFETKDALVATRQALESPQLQQGYAQCWQNLKKNFNPNRK